MSNKEEEEEEEEILGLEFTANATLAPLVSSNPPEPSSASSLLSSLELSDTQVYEN